MADGGAGGMDDGGSGSAGDGVGGGAGSAPVLCVFSALEPSVHAADNREVRPHESIELNSYGDVAGC
jgi:hypothetical protein